MITLFKKEKVLKAVIEEIALEKERKLRNAFENARTEVPDYREIDNFTKVEYHLKTDADIDRENTPYFIPDKVIPEKYEKEKIVTLFLNNKEITDLEEVLAEVHNYKDNNLAIETDTLHKERERYENQEKIREIKKNGKILGNEDLPWYYNMMGKPEIAEELRKHKHNLELNQDKLDAKEILNFKYKDKKRLFVDILPEKVKAIREVERDIQELVEQRNGEINNAALRLRKTNEYRQYNQEEYNNIFGLDRTTKVNKGRINLKEEWHNQYTGNLILIDDEAKNFAVTKKTIREERDKIIDNYDPQIKDLCEQRAEYEKPLFELCRAIKNADNYKRKNITKQQYKALNHAYRTLRRCEDLEKIKAQWDRAEEFMEGKK